MLNSKTLSSMKDRDSGLGGNEDFEISPPSPPKEPVGQKVKRLENMLKTWMQDRDRRTEELFEYQRQSNEVLHKALSQIASQSGTNSIPLPQLPPFPRKDDDTNAGTSGPH